MSHSHRVHEFLDTTAPQEQQARQVSELRNAFRNGARTAIQNRVVVEKAIANDPDLTWDQLIDKYRSQGFSGDDLWKKILGSAKRVRYDDPNYIPPKYN